MTHRGPFQTLLFCDSVILCGLARRAPAQQNASGAMPGVVGRAGLEERSPGRDKAARAGCRVPPQPIHGSERNGEPGGRGAATPMLRARPALLGEPGRVA